MNSQAKVKLTLRVIFAGILVLSVARLLLLPQTSPQERDGVHPIPVQEKGGLAVPQISGPPESGEGSLIATAVPQVATNSALDPSLEKEGTLAAPGLQKRGRNNTRLFPVAEEAGFEIGAVHADPLRWVIESTDGRKQLLGDEIPDEHTLSATRVSLDRKALGASLSGGVARILLPTVDGEEMEVVLDRRVTRGDRSQTLIGTITGQEMSQVIVVVNEEAVYATSANYAENRHWEYVSLSGDTMRVRELDTTSYTATCGNPGDLPQLESHGMMASAAPADPSVVGIEAAAALGDPVDTTPTPGYTTVDLVVGYGSAALQAAGGVAAMEARIIAAVDRTNQAMLSSGVGRVELILLGTVEDPGYVLPGSDPGSMLDELRDLDQTSTGNPALNTVSDLADLLGADLKSFVVKDVNGNDAGRAYLNGSSGIVALDYMSSNRMAWAHEIGHNFGCSHAWGDTDSASDLDTSSDNKGWRFSVGGVKYATIMAYDYAWNRVPNFSSPYQYLSGSSVRTGAFKGQNVIGDPTVDPRLVSGGKIGTAGTGYTGLHSGLGAYNAGTIQSNASSVAGFGKRFSSSQPEIVVRSRDVDYVIPDGDNLPLPSKGLGFDSVVGTHEYDFLNFHIQNLGGEDLILGSVTSSDPQFTISSFPRLVPPGGTVSFSVKFSPTVAGNFTSEISFSSNDADESPFNFTVRGSGYVRTSDDHGYDYDTATQIDSHSTTYGRLSIGDTDYFRIKIWEEGTLHLYTTGDADARGVVGGDLVDSNDSSSGSNNFDITLDVGTTEYVLAIINKRDLWGEYYHLYSRFRRHIPPTLSIAGSSGTVGQVVTNIQNGDMSPSTVDGTDMGAREYMGPDIYPRYSKKFTVSNTGTEDLVIENVESSNGEFSTELTSGPVGYPLTIRPGESQTVRVYMLSESPGDKEAIIRLESNDPANNPFTFKIKGEVIADSHGKSFESATVIEPNSFTDGALEFAPDVDYFTVDIPTRGILILETPGSQSAFQKEPWNVLWLVLRDEGSNVLGSARGLLSPVVTPGTYHLSAGDFTITGIQEGAYRLYSSFIPVSEGAPRQIAVYYQREEIDNFDLYPSHLKGTDYGDVEFKAGFSSLRSFRIWNHGDQNLEINSVVSHLDEFLIEDSFPRTVIPGQFVEVDIRYTPSAYGPQESVISINSNDPEDPFFYFMVKGTGIPEKIIPIVPPTPTPEPTPAPYNGILVESLDPPGYILHGTDGESYNEPFTDFGEVGEISGERRRKFRIVNLSGTILELRDWTTSTDFQVETREYYVAPDASMDFTIRFSPDSLGLKEEYISLYYGSYDSDSALYRFTVRGTGVTPPSEPILKVTAKKVVEIENNDLSPGDEDGTLFDLLNSPTGSLVFHRFQVHNLGGLPLRLGPAISSSPYFRVFELPSEVLPGEIGEFAIRFNPYTLGEHSGNIQFTTNDSNHPLFSFAVSGSGLQVVPGPVEAIFEMSYNGIELLNGDTTPTSQKGTDFGFLEVENEILVRGFRIYNAGSATLTLGLASSSEPSFSVQGVASEIAAGGFDDFTVTFDPGSAGTKTATISFTTNDSDITPFNFMVSGEGTDPPTEIAPPEITVSGNGMNITDGDSSPGATDGTDFGSVNYVNGSVIRTFRVDNTGESTLVLGTGSSNDSEFVVSGLASSIPPDGSDMFTITFNPDSEGMKQANISFSTNDSNENPFSFTVRGVGTMPLGTSATFSTAITYTMELPQSFANVPKVKVKGLPKGLKLDKKTGMISGVPSAAGSFEVVVSAPGVETETMILTIEALPEWAMGRFSGWVNTEEHGPGLVEMDISSNGRIAGRYQFNGSSYRFKESSYFERASDGSYRIHTEAGKGKESFSVSFSVYPPSEGGPALLSYVDGTLFSPYAGSAELFRRIWDDTGAETILEPYIGYYTAALPGGEGFGSGYLTFTIDEKGSVRTAGSLADGTKVSASGSLIYDPDGKTWIPLYCSPQSYEGGALYGIIEFEKVGSTVVVKPLDDLDLLWQSYSESATGSYGEGFYRLLGIEGGWYDQLVNLQNAYAEGLVVDEVELPIFVAKVKYPEGNRLEDVAAESEPSPEGLVLAASTKGISAPKSDKVLRDKASNTYDFATDTNQDGEINTSALSFKVKSSTGIFSAKFNAWYSYDANRTSDKDAEKLKKQSLKVQGILLPVQETPEESVVGSGYYLWRDAGRTDSGKSYKYNRSFDFLLLDPFED